MLSIFQLGLNSTDLAGTLRLYSEAFGFVNAGGQCIWGDTIKIQGLDEKSRAVMWWLVGRQSFFQLEFFHHTRPQIRPLPADWRASDHGWVRFGVSVEGFDATLAALKRHDVPITGGPVTVDKLRRAVFRDPYIGVYVEVMEEGPSLPGPKGPPGSGPAIVYIASSVSDIPAARKFYRDDLDAEILPLDILHSPAHEALWDLADAKREGFVARVGDSLVEVVSYANPAGRPKPADHRISDQGIMNIALGSRAKADITAVLARLERKGLRPPHFVEEGDLLAGYILDPEREIELVAIPEEMDAAIGLKPSNPFLA